MPRPRPWTDDDLREAVRVCGTLNAVCGHLGLSVGGETYESLREAMARLGLHLSGVRSATVGRLDRSWTDDQLRDAVRQSSSLREVSTRLGLTTGSRRNENLRRHIRRLGIECSHLPRTEAPSSSRRSWTDDELRNVVRQSRGVSEVLRRLGYVPNGGMHRFIQAKIAVLGIDTSHFTGQSWSRGLSNPQGPRAIPLDQILVADSAYPSSKLRLRLVAAGLKEARCELCGLVNWLGAPITLALDHINGDPTDNRLANLRILCPNCHAQTDTWCGRKRSRSSPTYGLE